MATTLSSKNRLHFLDGLRGLGSVIVLFFHVTLCFFIPPDGNPLGRLLDGSFAVKLFFILSGFSLSIGFFLKEKNRDLVAFDSCNFIISKTTARYFRLAIPSLCAAFLVYLISSLGINYYKYIPESMRLEWWEWAYTNTNVSIQSLLKFSLYDIFFQHPFLPLSKYDTPYYITNLWTMSVELYGSFLVFFSLLAFGNKRKRTLVYFCMFVFFTACNSYYSFFMAGVLLADLYTKDTLAPQNKYVRSAFTPLFIIIFGFVPPGQFGSLDVLYCAVLVYFVMYGPMINKLFESALFRYLGQISFALYLVHIPVIISLQSFLFINADTSPIPLNNFIIGSVSIVVSFVAAHFFSSIDRVSIKTSHYISRTLNSMK